MNSVKKIWWWSLAAKLLLAAVFPLSQDEAYYWVWSKHLQLSYFDHPGMVAWLLWLGHWLEPLGQAVRWPNVILGHLTLLIWIFILDKNIAAKEPLKSTKLKFFLWLALSSPMIGFGSLLSTPDVPVVFFWSLSALLVSRILEKKEKWDYLFLGAALGLGFCSKYHIVLFVLALVLWLIFQKKWAEISLKGIGLTFLSGLIFSSPVLIWNFQNQFQSFQFQLNHGLGSNDWEFFWTSSYLLAQFLLLGPVSVWMAFKCKLPESSSFLKYLAWVPLGFFLFSSFKGVVEVNWPITAFPAVYCLAIIASRNMKPLWWTIVPWAIVAILVSVQNFLPFTDFLPDRVVETHYFDPVLSFLKSEKIDTPIYFGSYQMASRVWWENKAPAKKLFQISRHDLFDEMQEHPNEDISFFVIKENWIPWPTWVSSDHYEIKKTKDIPPKFEVFTVVKK